MHKTRAQQLLAQDPELLFCYLVVEVAEPASVTRAANNLTGQLKNALVVKTPKFRALESLVFNINAFLKRANTPPPSASPEEFKKTASNLVAAIDTMCRLQDVFQLLGEYTEMLAKKRTEKMAPGSDAGADTQQQQPQPDQDSSTPGSSLEKPEQQTPPEEPVEPKIADLLRELGKEVEFKSNLKKCFAGQLPRINRTALNNKYREHVSFVRNKAFELFGTQDRERFISQVLGLTVPELQDLALKIAPSLVFVGRMKAELAGSDVPTVAKIFGIPDQQAGILVPTDQQR